MKKVGYSLYVHKSNIDELFNVVNREEVEYINSIINYAVKQLGIDFAIVKYDKQSSNVSLIQCSTWDRLNEPIVEDSYCFHSDFTYKVIKGGTKVYHNKWQFVSPDYQGFDVEIAKKRTEIWNSIPNIKKYKSKIGNVTFWYALLKEYGIEI